MRLTNDIGGKTRPGVAYDSVSGQREALTGLMLPEGRLS